MKTLMPQVQTSLLGLRRLPAVATVIGGLLLAFAALPSWAATETKIVGDKGSAWPAEWTELASLRDAGGDTTPGKFDFTVNAKGTGTVYWAKSSDYVYFRLRMNIPTADITTYRDNFWIYLKKVGYSANVADYAIAWDSAGGGGNSASHGVEMQIYSAGTTWDTLTFSDLDAAPGSKGTIDINGGGRTTDGYLRLLSSLTGDDANTTFIDWAVSWAYLTNNTALRPEDTWYFAVASKPLSTDHQSLGSYGVSDLAGYANYNSMAITQGGAGWSVPQTITPPSITNVANHTQTYGDTAVTVSGVVSAPGPVYPANGETVSVTINGVTQNATIAGGAGAFSLSFPIATIPYSATAYPITYIYAGNGSLDGTTNATTSLTINKAPLNITANSASKTYGTTYTVVGSGQTAFSSSGLKNSETIGSVTITASGGTLATAAAGAYSLTPSAATGGTFASANYSITYLAGTLTVDPAQLTVTPKALSRIYDGTTLNNGTYSATLANYTITGFQNGETAVSISLAFSGSMALNGSTSTAVKNVGTYTLAVGTLTLSSSGNNYALLFSNPSGNAYVITPKELAVTGLTAENKAADGTTAATLTGTASLQASEAAGSGSTSDGKPYSGDAVSVSGTPVGTFASAAVGNNISVSVSGLSLSGGQKDNYTLLPLTLSANITPGSIDHFEVTFSAAPYYVGLPFTTYATAKDAYGNTVTTDSSTVVTFTSSSGTMTWDGDNNGSYGNTSPNNQATLVSGVATIPTKDTAAGTGKTITASAGGKTGISAAIDIVPATGAYRTIASGNWSDASIWETWNGTTWVTAGAAPDASSGVISLRSPYFVTNNTSITVDQVVVESGATLVVSNGVTLTIGTASTPGIEVYGTLVNAGTVTTTGTLQFFDGGTYQHNYTTTAGTIPTATWNTGSTCEILGYTSNTATPGGLNQTFSNFIWNCPNQTGNINLGAGLTSVGNFTAVSTGTGSITLGASLAVTGTATVQSGATLYCGAYTISGGAFALEAGGTLGIGSPQGITASGLTGNIQTTSRSFSTEGNYIYTGTAAQVTGSGLPATVNSLTDSNTGGILTLSQATTITDRLTLVSGAQISLTGSTSAANLTIAGVAAGSGSWGATGSGATYESSSFTAGSMEVTAGVTTTFSNLTVSQTITYGATSLTLSGTVSGTGPVYPANGETVAVTINGDTQNTTTTEGDGRFSINYNPATIPHQGGVPYVITFYYAGSASLNPATNTSQTLTVAAAPLTVSANNQSKTYGTSLTLGAGQTAFTAVGLKNSETIGSVTLTASSGPPDGTQPTDPVGNYLLTPSAATGGTFDAANYDLTYSAGTLAVIPPALKITAATATPNGGTADALTLYLVDQSGATVTSLSGDYSFTFSGLADAADGTHPTVTDKTGAAVPLGTATTISFTDGVSSAGGALVAYRAQGPVTLHATDGATSTASTGGSGASLTVANVAPVVPTVNSERNRNVAWRMRISTLLAGVSDANKDLLQLVTVTDVTPAGALVQTNAYYVLYSPPTSGTETNAAGSFTYTVSDGTTTASGTVNITIAADSTGTNCNFVAYGMVSGSFVMTFSGVPGYTYEIQYTGSLPSSSWTTILTTNAPPTGLFSYTNPPAPGPSCFYRAINR